MILTRKMDLCLVVGLVWLGTTAEGAGGGELVTPPCQVCVVVVCFDTLAEEVPQAFDSRKRVLQQLGSGFVGDFNIGSRPLTMYCLGTGVRVT